MKINLELGTYGGGYSSYNLNGDFFLCFRKLNDYFELSDKPEKITVVIKKKPHKNSYLVKSHNSMMIMVLNSGGYSYFYIVNEKVSEFINKLGGSAYVSILA